MWPCGHAGASRVPQGQARPGTRLRVRCPLVAGAAAAHAAGSARTESGDTLGWVFLHRRFVFVGNLSPVLVLFVPGGHRYDAVPAPTSSGHPGAAAATHTARLASHAHAVTSLALLGLAPTHSSRACQPLPSLKNFGASRLGPSVAGQQQFCCPQTLLPSSSDNLPCAGARHLESSAAFSGQVFAGCRGEQSTAAAAKCSLERLAFSVEGGWPLPLCRHWRWGKGGCGPQCWFARGAAAGLTPVRCAPGRLPSTRKVHVVWLVRGIRPATL